MIPAALIVRLLPWAVLAITVAGALLYVRQGGYAAAESECKEMLSLRDAADQEAHQAAVEAAQRETMLMDQIAMDQALIAAQQSRKREIQYVEIIKWRTKYETHPDAGKCVVPDEFVRVLDAAGQDDGGVPAETPGRAGTDAVPRRVSDVEILRYATDAKLMCLKWRDRLIWWQERERALGAVK